MEHVVFLLLTLAGATHGKIKETNTHILQNGCHTVCLRGTILKTYFSLILLFPPAFSTGAETKCIISEDNSRNSKRSCSVTLGATLYIQMMRNASSHWVKFKKQLPTEPVNVFSLKRDEVTIQEPYKNRAEFFISNGTLKMMHVERNDSGQYTTEIFNKNGVFVKNINVTLDVQGKYLSFISQPIKNLYTYFLNHGVTQPCLNLLAQSAII